MHTTLGGAVVCFIGRLKPEHASEQSSKGLMVKVLGWKSKDHWFKLC